MAWSRTPPNRMKSKLSAVRCPGAFPSAPALLTVKRDGKEIDAVAQTTKQGFVYLFDRSNGTPLFPIEYRKYPASTVPGEVTAAEQPLPARPEPYARQLLTEDLLNNRTPE